MTCILLDDTETQLLLRRLLHTVANMLISLASRDLSHTRLEKKK